MKTLNSIVLSLIIIGAINWGLIGLFNINVLSTLFGGTAEIVSRILYILVGFAGIWAFTLYPKMDSQIDETK